MKHGALRLQKPLRLFRDREVWGSRIFKSNTYSSPPECLCIKVGSCEGHFNVSLIVWAKSLDSYHKPHFFKKKESRSGSNRGPSGYQPSSALPLGHTGSLVQESLVAGFIIQRVSQPATNFRLALKASYRLTSAECQ